MFTFTSKADPKLLDRLQKLYNKWCKTTFEAEASNLFNIWQKIFNSIPDITIQQLHYNYTTMFGNVYVRTAFTGSYDSNQKQHQQKQQQKVRAATERQMAYIFVICQTFQLAFPPHTLTFAQATAFLNQWHKAFQNFQTYKNKFTSQYSYNWWHNM